MKANAAQSRHLTFHYSSSTEKPEKFAHSIKQPCIDIIRRKQISKNELVDLFT
jgi:hypothetical protein